MLHRLRDILLAELQVPNTSEATLAELRERATNVRELGGDHRLEAFIVRIAQFQGTDGDVEGLAGLAVNKPPQTWVDTDIDRAEVGLAELAQEVFASRNVRSREGQARQEALDGCHCRNGRPSDTCTR